MISPFPRGAGRLFVALDTADLAAALKLADALSGHVGGVKLGKEFFTACGPEGVRRMRAAGLPVFLDLKYHDIPNTVAGAVSAAVGLGVAMLTIHASGGSAMIRAAAAATRSAAAARSAESPLVLAVTVLTSLDDSDLDAVGQKGPVAEQVCRLAALAEEAGADGVVASPHEVAQLRAERRPGFSLVVPGVRPSWAAQQDQKRVLSPAEAVRAGADYLVVGRPITDASDPREAARRIADEIAAAEN